MEPSPPSLSQGELLNTKTVFLVDILQLTRAVSQKQKLRSKVSTVRGFPVTMDVDEVGLCLHLGS